MCKERSLSIGAIAIDPCDGDNIFAGTGEPYIRLIYPGVGVLQSVNGGKSWNEIGPEIVTSTAKLKIVGETLVCAAGEGLFIRKKYGGSWSVISFGQITDVCTLGDSLLVGLYGLGIFRYDSNGSWQELGRGQIRRPKFRVLFALGQCSECHRQTIYARVDEAVYCSHDDGNNWSLVGELPPPTSDPDWASCIASHPLNPHRIFVGGESLGYFETSCDGSLVDFKRLDLFTCRSREEGIANCGFRDHHEFAFNPKDPNIVYVANDGGIFRSSDGGIHWEKRSDGLNVTQFYDLAVSSLDQLSIGGGTQDRGTWIKRKGRWQQVRGGDGGQMEFDPINPDIAWIQEQANGVRIVTMPSQNRVRPDSNPWFRGLFGPASFISPLLAVPVNGERVLLTGRRQIFREMPRLTIDEANWTPISQDLEGVCSALAIDHRSGIVFAGTSGGRLWKSQPNVVNTNISEWESISARLKSSHPKRPINRLVISERSTEQATLTLYLCYGGFSETIPACVDSVYRVSSSDGVSWSWTNISGFSENPCSRLPNVAAHGLAITEEAECVLYAATDAGVYRSVDDGQTWHDFSNGLPNVPCFDIHLYQPGDRNEPGLLRVATHGRGIWEIRV